MTASCCDRATAVSATAPACTVLDDHADATRITGSLTATCADHRLANISISAAPAFHSVFRSARSAPLSADRARRALPVESPSHPGHGGPLDGQLRADMEPRFGYDFSRVRIYTDPQAARLAGAFQARAYTLGQSVVFGAGQYRPGDGRRTPVAGT